MMFKLKLPSSIGLVLVLCACSAQRATPPTTRADSLALSDTAENDQILKSSPLDQLWKSRSSNATDFPIGVGDVLEISAPGLQGSDAQYLQTARGEHSDESLTDESSSTETVRVDGVGDIVLPLLDRIHVAGLTEEELRTELMHRLDPYMYDPDVKIFVKSYISRAVAVSGEVHTPGMYTVNAPGETIQDLIMRAGGSTGSAVPKVVITPAKEDAPGAASPAPAHPIQANPPDDLKPPASWQATGATSNAASYVIDLGRQKSSERYLGIPVRPGDTIYIPRAGSVTVTGWVYTPKSVDITPGLTVLGAISAAGGPLFAADTTHVKILRQGAGQKTTTTVVNLNNIKAARSPDVLVQANDIVDIPYSTFRIPGYALYYGVKGMVDLAPAMMLVGGAP